VHAQPPLQATLAVTAAAMSRLNMQSHCVGKRLPAGDCEYAGHALQGVLKAGFHWSSALAARCRTSPLHKYASPELQHFEANPSRCEVILAEVKETLCTGYVRLVWNTVVPVCPPPAPLIRA